jgi:hypothetical protein
MVPSTGGKAASPPEVEALYDEARGNAADAGRSAPACAKSRSGLGSIPARCNGLVALALSRTAPQTSSRSGRVKRTRPPSSSFPRFWGLQRAASNAVKRLRRIVGQCDLIATKSRVEGFKGYP